MNFLEAMQKAGAQKIKRTHGKQYTALCPFHEEQNPSFSFNNKDGLFKCHGCGKQGNLYQFLILKLGYTKAEAMGAIYKQNRITPEQEKKRALAPTRAVLLANNKYRQSIWKK